MILHLAQDEKFIDMGFGTFEEAAPGQNECMVLTWSLPLKYIKSIPYTVINLREADFKALAKDLERYDFVVLHSLDQNIQKILQYVSRKLTIVWIGFGYDYYDLIVEKQTDLYDPLTTRLFEQHHPSTPVQLPFYKNDKYFPVRMLNKIKQRLSGEKTKKEIIDNIDFFAPVLNSEYDMVKSGFGKYFAPKFIDWNYGSLEDDPKVYENLKISSTGILLGNSSSYENNHLEIMELLKRFNVSDRKIIAPLSYGGGGKKYCEAIANKGRELFGVNFSPLVDYVSLNEYTNIISSCSVVIMNHIRQQAFGNIETMMIYGATIFLKKENPIYSFLKEDGAVIFTIEELEKNPNLIDYRLSLAEIDINKEVSGRDGNKKLALKKTKNLINMALNKR